MTDIAESIGILMAADGRGDIAGWDIDSGRDPYSNKQHYSITAYTPIAGGHDCFTVGHSLSAIEFMAVRPEHLIASVIGSLLDQLITGLRKEGVLKECGIPISEPNLVTKVSSRDD